jgi:predicted nucleotidyltransferase component of viral defense system
MKIEPQDFHDMVRQALREPAMARMRPVIEKELLHYDILFCLEQSGLLDSLVFQGGTSLRLCYGANRFSEDLDFAGGRDFDSKQLSVLKDCIEEYIGSRYGLEVGVKEPKSLMLEPTYKELKIEKWQISIVTATNRRDIPKQRIKIEVANVPAYTKSAKPLIQNYKFLPDGYDDTLIYTETLDEVMADKLVSLPATRRYIRHRDIWDLAWLKQQKAVCNADLVFQKLVDYKIDNFSSMLAERIRSIPDIVNGDDFKGEMLRFLPTDVFERTIGKHKFNEYLINTLCDLLKEIESELEENTENMAGEFKM